MQVAEVVVKILELEGIEAAFVSRGRRSTLCINTWEHRKRSVTTQLAMKKGQSTLRMVITEPAGK